MGGGEAERGHVLGESAVLLGETVDFVGGLEHALERRAQFRPAEAAHGADQAEIMQAGQVGEFLEALEHAADPRQIFAQIEAGRVFDEFLVLVRLHVFAVEILVGLVVADAVTRPDQLLVVDRIEHRAGRDIEQQRIMHVGLQLEERPLAQRLGFFVIIHQLAMADAAELGQPEGAEHRGRHAVRLLEIDAIHDALPARVIGGLGLGRLHVGLRRVHAATPIQFLHSETASIALVPKASAPV